MTVHTYLVMLPLSPSKAVKKDPGIPNLFPFKEQLLKQMEEKKRRSEEERARQKLQRKEQSKRKSLQSLHNDSQRRSREFERKVSMCVSVSTACAFIHVPVVETLGLACL